MKGKLVINGHFWLSLVKSFGRIGAAYFLYCSALEFSAICFASSELLGIAEEFFN